MAIMSAKRVRHLPVISGGELLGIVSIGDLVKSIISDREFVIEQLEQMLGIGRASLARGRAARCSAPHRSPPYDLGEPASPPPLLNEGPDLGGVGCVAGIRSGPLAPEQSHLDTIFAPRSRHLRGHQHDLRTLEVALCPVCHTATTFGWRPLSAPR